MNYSVVSKSTSKVSWNEVMEYTISLRGFNSDFSICTNKIYVMVYRKKSKYASAWLFDVHKYSNIIAYWW